MTAAADAEEPALAEVGVRGAACGRAWRLMMAGATGNTLDEAEGR